MLRRQPRRACIKVLAVLKAAGLCRAVGHFDACTVSNCPIASASAAARLQDRAAVTSLLKFPGCDHACDSSAENHDTFSLAGTFWKTDLTRCCFWKGQQTQGLHHHVSCTKATDLAHLHQKRTSRRHFRNPLLRSVTRRSTSHGSKSA